MNSLNLLLSTIFLAAFGSTLIKSESCSTRRVQIICSRVEKTQWVDGLFYSCAGSRSIISMLPGSSVSSIVHGNGSEVTNLLQIEGFYISTAKVKFIPSGIGSRLQKIKTFQIFQCGLLSVSKEDLKDFGSSLELIYLGYNKLTVIDADLFEFNLLLKKIYLDNNPIRHIDPEFFTNLKKLRNIVFVEIYETSCISQEFETSNRHNITTFKWRSEKCMNETAKIELKNMINDNLCDETKIAG